MSLGTRFRLKSRHAVATITLLIIAGIGVILVRQRQFERGRAAREAGYAAVMAVYAERMKPGLTREEVEQQLRAEGKAFSHMCCMGTSHNAFDTLVKIGEESVPWFCSEHYVYVGFEFASKGTHGHWEARPDDQLVDIRLYKQLSGCL